MPVLRFKSSAPSLRRMSGERVYMRTLVRPPPSSRCDLCSGELRLKLIEPADQILELENEIFVCANCGHEQVVYHDP